MNNWTDKYDKSVSFWSNTNFKNYIFPVNLNVKHLFEARVPLTKEITVNNSSE